MKALCIHAGPLARHHLQQHGLQPGDVSVIPAAAGGPKGLILGPLDRYISAAVGDDPVVARELRASFAAGARDLADLMRRARCDANWNVAALRLKGLAATFGIVPLIQLAEHAMAGAPGDPAVLRDILHAIDAID